jgi:hypothetical protein
MLTLASHDIQNTQDGDFSLKDSDFSLKDCSSLKCRFQLLKLVFILLYLVVSIGENVFKDTFSYK